MRRLTVVLLFCLGLIGWVTVWAQPVSGLPTFSVAQFASRYTKEIDAYPPLRFASEIVEMGVMGASSNGIYRPVGEGPFPAVVLVHSCGGLEPHLTERAKELLNAGFVVLVLDSQGPRGIRSCDELRFLQVPLVSRDAFAALKHLAQRKEVDAERIFLVGFSLGSFVAAAMASPELASTLASDGRFRASVGWYGSCAQNTQRSRWQLLSQDADRPVLLLLAGKDAETPIAECFPLLEQMKTVGKPVAWHVYEDATHAWDKTNLRRGYVHSVPITRDAMLRTIAFLRQN